MFHTKAISKNAIGDKTLFGGKITDYVVDYGEPILKGTPSIRITLERNIDVYTSFYALTPDLWFRKQRPDERKRTYGLMIRNLKITGNGKPWHSEGSTIAYPALISYDTYEAGSDYFPEDAIRETTKGFVIIKGTDFSTETPHGFTGKDVELWVNRNAHKWQP